MFVPTGLTKFVPKSSVDNTDTAPAATGPVTDGQPARVTTSALFAAIWSPPLPKNKFVPIGTGIVLVIVMTVPAVKLVGLCANPGGMPCASLPSPQI